MTQREQNILIAVLTAAITLGVVSFAWASDDAYITFRHLQNVWAGHGPVFNAGEPVQGFTHPLWFGVLLVGNVIVADPVLLAMALGTVLTAGTVLLACRLLFQRGVVAMLAVMVIWGTSPSFLAFQTSGLENALSHLLLLGLVYEGARHGLDRPFRITLLWALLGTNRLDFAAACLPTILLLLPTMRTPKRWGGVALGALPAVAWAAFALGYYGDLLPNTAHAKVGIFPSVGSAMTQGLRYLWDFVSVEPVAATAMFAGLAAGLTLKSPLHKALAVGGWLHIVYVVWVGGDFMRGRFLLVPFVLGTLLGGLALPTLSKKAAGIGLALAGALGLLTAAIRPSAGEIPASGILEERSFYPWMHLPIYLTRGPQSPYMERSMLDGLTAYAETCGPVTIHGGFPGSVATLAGPDVRVIDLLGLTDRTIAELPRSSLVVDPPRVGHPFKRIPVGYLANRSDIALLEGWEEAVMARDCDFSQGLEGWRQDTETTWYGGQPLLPARP